MSPVGRVSGAATHAFGGDAGYGLLRRLPHRPKRPPRQIRHRCHHRCRGQRRIRPTDHQLRQTGRERAGYQVCEIGRDVKGRRQRSSETRRMGFAQESKTKFQTTSFTQHCRGQSPRYNAH